MNKHKKKPMKPRYILWLIIILCLVFIGVSLNNNGEKLSIQKGISAFPSSYGKRAEQYGPVGWRTEGAQPLRQ